MIDKLDKWLQQKKAERIRRARISSSLKSYHAIKRAEKGYHRVRYSEMGEYVGYYLVKNI